MRISFHGAARTVTGSKHLLTLDTGVKILLDCGLFQGMGKQTDELNRTWGFDPASIDYLVLSHAHIDHSGLIPKLFKDGFKGKIFCTHATKDLAAILLEDSAVIQKADTKYINRKRTKQGLPLFEPLYEVDNVKQVLQLFSSVDYGEWIPVTEGVELMFTDAGHIIGSAAVNLRITEGDNTTAITFSGDIGRYTDAILRAPEVFPQADYIILESTYGNRLHDEVHGTSEGLLYWINKTCIEKKGKLIIPAFSVGRTQELLYALNELEEEGRLPKVKYYVDSPLSKEATEVVKSYPAIFNNKVKQVMENDSDPFDFTGLSFIESVGDSKAINSNNDACVIIASSGMADAGRVRHHIRNHIQKTSTTILMVGYASPYSLGGKLLAGVKRVNIYGDEYEVRAEVGKMRSMSAHADYEDLCQFLACQDTSKVKKLFLVHGEYDVQVDFAKRLIRKGFQVDIPGMNYVTELP